MDTVAVNSVKSSPVPSPSHCHRVNTSHPPPKTRSIRWRTTLSTLLHPAPGWIPRSSFKVWTMSTSPAFSSQIVTLPHIPELFQPDFLDVLLPPRTALSTDANVAAPVPKSAFMDALKSVAHHKVTENGAPAFSSTLSSTLDAFQSLSVDMDTLTINGVLARAWAEDPALTLKIIWNTRSIHDGKGDKELFYRYVPSLSYVCALSRLLTKLRRHLGLLVGSMSTTHVRRSVTFPNSSLRSA